MDKQPSTATSSDDVRKSLMKTRIGDDLADLINPTLINPTKRRSKRASSKTFASKPAELFAVVIELNRGFPGGSAAARKLLFDIYLEVAGGDAKRFWDLAYGYPVVEAAPVSDSERKELEAILREGAEIAAKSLWTDNYVFAKLSAAAINALVKWEIDDPNSKGQEDGRKIPFIYKIWRDHQIERCVYESVKTTKCDAAHTAFAASGKGIVWAVADTGIDKEHPHFKAFKTLDLPAGLKHQDFTTEDLKTGEDSALLDNAGHGTHVAGIIAGHTSISSEPKSDGVKEIRVTRDKLQEDGSTSSFEESVDVTISGMAPQCKLISLKVLSDNEAGPVSNLLAAIGYILRKNDYGRHLKIHGLNLSLGYPFNARWFAAGQSPLCVEVNRLVRSGVCVVAAAGNAGYGTVTQFSGGVERASHLGTILDPGNAELAITVGSTHRDEPHTYGISYFSSKGPTADGRMKPDIVAPGERIVSCALQDTTNPAVALFREDSGTSMAAPHVSGAIAAFLSVRAEFIGQPERVKQIFVDAAIDLKRRPEFQGSGMIDSMRALQSV